MTLGIISFPLFKNKLFQRYCSSGSHVFEFLLHNFEKSAPGNQRRPEVVIERFAAGFLRYWCGDEFYHAAYGMYVDRNHSIAMFRCKCVQEWNFRCKLAHFEYYSSPLRQRQYTKSAENTKRLSTEWFLKNITSRGNIKHFNNTYGRCVGILNILIKLMSYVEYWTF